ncbi:MAG: ABC transporter permease subunit [Gammaproteobacteria bacterium]|nr:ABC transporter permease subunit [Gammaproteobacteria bacterium]MDH5305079.1 ABC transporter permease subunit [Gammaproteobacteria bacterium]MDH5322925.1 ABC transporter permease subunit [Gammaproteobacteria bacterium]
MASLIKKDTLWRHITVLVPYLWLLVFFLLPFGIILKISLAEPVLAQPPFSPTFDETGALSVNTDNFAFLFRDKLYALTYLKSVLMAAAATICCLLLGFPIAYGIARSDPRTRSLLLLLIVLPFWISFLLRVYAWMGLLGNYGVINNFLMWLGITAQPIQILYTDFAIFLGLAYSYLPFMILPLYATLERMDLDLVDAAMDLGASRTTAFWDITWPLARAGVIAGCMLVFIPAMGEYVIPYLLGGPDALLIGRVLFDEFYVNRDWPLASAVAIMLLVLLVVPIVVLQRNQARDEEQAI